MSERFDSKKAAEPVGHFPHARRVGGLLFLSGIGPRERGTNRIPPAFEDQCRAVFANVRHVLEDAGSSWERLVDVTVYQGEERQEQHREKSLHEVRCSASIMSEASLESA